MFNFSIIIDKQNVKQIQQDMNKLFYSMVFIKKTKSMRPPPVTFSSETYEFFKIPEAALPS